MNPHLKSAAAVLGALAMSACITINIYFPASAAEKAADSIIDEVWKTPAPAAVPAATPAAKEKTQ